MEGRNVVRMGEGGAGDERGAGGADEELGMGVIGLGERIRTGPESGAWGKGSIDGKFEGERIG